jgi:hypothetical protein
MTMRAARQGLAWVLASALLACSASAWGAEPGPDALPINVIAVQTADADDQAEALTKALRNAVRATPGWALGEGDYSLEVLTLSLKCPEPPDANCQSRIADQIKADRYIWAVIKKKGATIQGELYLWVRGQGTSKVPVSYAANLTEANDESLVRIATSAVTQLTGGPPKGSLHVKAGNVPGQVFLDGQPVGALQGGEGTFIVPSGSHQVTVKARGYTDGESQVVVRPVGAPAEVALTLMPIEVKTQTNWKMIGGYTAIGLGVGSGVVGLIGSLKINSLNSQANQDGKNGEPESPMHEYRRVKGQGAKDVCDDARNDLTSADMRIKLLATKTNEICQQASVPFTLQLIFYPLAAVSAGAGIYLLGTSLSSDKPATTGFRILPEAGPGGAKINVLYTW